MEKKMFNFGLVAGIIFILVVAGFSCKKHNEYRAQEQLWSTGAGTPEVRVEERIVTIGDVPVELRRAGMKLHFKILTKDVRWFVQPENGAVITRAPINSPDFKDLDFGDAKSVRVWVESDCKARLHSYKTIH